MFGLNVDLLRDRGIARPKVYLRGKGMSNGGVEQWMAGQMKRVELRVLFEVCVELGCTPNDLLVLRGDARVPVGHVLEGLRPVGGPSAEEVLRGMTVEELREWKKAAKAALPPEEG